MHFITEFLLSPHTEESPWKWKDEDRSSIKHDNDTGDIIATLP